MGCGERINSSHDRRYIGLRQLATKEKGFIAQHCLFPLHNYFSASVTVC